MAKKSGRVSEMAAFFNRKPLPLSIIEFPSKRWGFVGRVPMDLSYEGSAEDLEIGRRHGFGLVSGRVKRLTWETKDEALAAAKAKGYTVANA
jgi:hypothetical protein